MTLTTWERVSSYIPMLPAVPALASLHDINKVLLQTNSKGKEMFTAPMTNKRCSVTTHEPMGQKRDKYCFFSFKA